MAEPAAQGIWVPRIGEEVFRLCNELVDDIVTVTDAEIAEAVTTPTYGLTPLPPMADTTPTYG